jgi:hypothetical protein
MALQRNSLNKKRRYISKDILMGKVFLVYVYDIKGEILVSDGPFREYRLAENIMRTKLSEGICSWVVTYNE